MQSWGTEQVDWLLAYDQYRSSLNPLGFPIDEATSEEANPANAMGSYSYRSIGPRTDFSMKVSHDAEDAYRAEKGEKANLNGVTFPVVRVERSPSDVDPYSLEGL